MRNPAPVRQHEREGCHLTLFTLDHTLVGGAHALLTLLNLLEQEAYFFRQD